MALKTIFSSGTVRQFIAGSICSITIGIVGVLVGWTSAAIPKLQNGEANFIPTSSEITWIVSALHVGNLASAIPGSILMDIIGRKMTLLAVAFFPAISWIIVYFATEAYHLYIARFLSGLSLGCGYMISPVYLSEIAEPKIRGSIGTLMAIMLNLGVSYEYMIGPYVDYNTLTILSMLIPIIFIIAFLQMPESPYYYSMKNRNDKAIKSLIWLRNDQTEDAIINEMNSIDSAVKLQLKNKGSYSDLICTKSNRKALIMMLLVSFFQRLSGMGPIMHYASITIPENSISFLSLNQCLTAMSITWGVSNIITIPIIDKFNRRTLLSISSIGVGLTMLATGSWFYLEQFYPNLPAVEEYRWVPFVSFIIHALFYAVGLGSIGGSIRGELFSANVKGKSLAVTQIVSALYSFAVSNVYLVVRDNYGMYVNYYVYGFGCLSAVLFIKFYLVETKGKTLQTIQDELNGIKNP